MFRAKQLLSEWVIVTVLTDDPGYQIKEAEVSGELNLRSGGIATWKSAIDEIAPFLVVVSTGDERLDGKLPITHARYLS